MICPVASRVFRHPRVNIAAAVAGGDTLCVLAAGFIGKVVDRPCQIFCLLEWKYLEILPPGPFEVGEELDVAVFVPTWAYLTMFDWPCELGHPVWLDPQ